jgi:PAS domain S-box-containing protein
VAEDPSFPDVAEALALGLPFRMHVNADGETRFLHVGATSLQALGVAAEAIVADPHAFDELIFPQDRARLRVEKHAALAERRPASVELRIRRPDGEAQWKRVTFAPRWLADGGSQWDGLIIDITESRRLAEQLTDERRRLELAVELSQIGLFHWDRDEPDMIHWSDHQYAIYGVAPGTPMTVRAFRNQIHPDDRGNAYFARRWAARAADGDDRTGEYRIIRPNGDVRWVLSHQRVRRDAEGIKTVQGTTVDITERRNAEERRRLQMRELAHRGKNTIAVMMAMVQQAARGADNVEAFAGVLMARLDAMARSQELASATEGAPLGWPILFRQALEPFDIERFDFDPALEAQTIPADAVIPMGLLLHELATNAVKYGALSDAEGRIQLSRRAAPDGWLALEWRERGGPEVAPPERGGFGMRLLGQALNGVGGTVEPVFAPQGFVARLQMPAA